MSEPCVTGCVCESAGFCQRHGCEKTSTMRMLCCTRLKFFDAWEAGHGPNEQQPVRVLSPGVLTTSPPLLARAWSFTSALVRWSLGGFRRRTKAEIATLAAICEACPRYAGRVCTACGCACTREKQFLNKLAWRSETCPENKWPV